MILGTTKVLWDAESALFPQDCYYIYLDIKDSNSVGKLPNSTIFFAITLRFERPDYRTRANVRSHESDHSMSRSSMGDALASESKLRNEWSEKSLMEKMQKLSRYCLTQNHSGFEKKK